MNTEGAGGAMRRIANTGITVKRRVAYAAVMNTAPGDLVEHWPLSRRIGDGVIIVILMIIIRGR